MAVWLCRDEFVFLSFLEPENDAGVISKIALVIVTACKVIAKSGQNKINLRRADSDIFCHRNIDPSADDEVPCIIAGVIGGDAVQLACLSQILVHVGVSASKESFYKRLEMRGAVFNDWTDVIGE